MHSKKARIGSNIFFVEKWIEMTQNMHIDNTDKICFYLNFLICVVFIWMLCILPDLTVGNIYRQNLFLSIFFDLCGLHLDALHLFTLNICIPDSTVYFQLAIFYIFQESSGVGVWIEKIILGSALNCSKNWG